MNTYLNPLDEQVAQALNYGVSFDVLRKEIRLQKETVVLYVINSLLNGEAVNDLISSLDHLKTFDDILYEAANSSIQVQHDLQKALGQVFSGVALILGEKEEQGFYLLEVRNYPTRGVEEPSTEKSVRGSKDGFVENIITNVGLIRRRIKDENLIIKILEVGKKSRTNVVVAYLKDGRFAHVAQELEQLIPTLDVDELVMSDRALVEGLFKQKYNHYPLVRYSERPDVVAVNLLQGYVAIVVDTSPSVIITPTTIFEHTEHVEEYRQTPIVGTFTRLFRWIAIVMSIFLVPLWMVIVTETEFSGVFLIKPADPLTVPLLVQVLIVEVMFEILRIATIHTPSSLSSAMGLVAALLLGQMAVDIGVFIPEVLLYGALSAMGGFATPSYELSLANKITKIYLIILVGLLGKFGFMIGVFFMFIHLTSLKVFQVPYLYPFIPFDRKKFINLIFRHSSNKTI